MKLSFSQWLESTQSLEIQVAHFLEEILSKAANIKKQEVSAGIFRTFSYYAQSVWPQNAKNKTTLVLPNTFPEDVAGQPVRFHLLQSNKQADTIHQQGKFAGFDINTANFDNCQNPEEVDAALEAMKSTIHHEVEHIYNVGKEYRAGENQEKAIQYMNDPGEMKAYARQIAHQYAKNFPGQTFDIKKAQSILNQPGFTQTHRNYLSNPHQIMNLIPQYLTQYTT